MTGAESNNPSKYELQQFVSQTQQRLEELRASLNDLRQMKDGKATERCLVDDSHYNGRKPSEQVRSERLSQQRTANEGPVSLKPQNGTPQSEPQGTETAEPTAALSEAAQTNEAIKKPWRAGEFQRQELSSQACVAADEKLEALKRKLAERLGRA